VPPTYAPAERGFSIVTLDEFVEVEEPGDAALVGDAQGALIPEGANVMFYGDGGAGKTTLTMDLACHLAGGDDWLGIPISHPVRVLVVENEGPRPLFRKKLKHKRDGWTGSPLGDRLILVEEPWARLTLDNAEHREVLATKIDELAIDVVVIGPVTASGMQEAGTLQEVRAFADLLEKVRELSGRRVTFVLVHHENKGGKVSGAWEGCGDTLVHVQGEGQGRTRLYVQKARWASSLHGTTLHLVWTEGEGFAVVDKESRQGQIEAKITEATVWIVEYIHEHPGSARSKVETAFHEAHGGGRNTARKAVDRQLEELARWRMGGECPPALATTTGESPRGVYLIPFTDADSPLAGSLFGEVANGGSDPDSGRPFANSPPTLRVASVVANRADGVEKGSSEDEVLDAEFEELEGDDDIPF